MHQQKTFVTQRRPVDELINQIGVIYDEAEHKGVHIHILRNFAYLIWKAVEQDITQHQHQINMSKALKPIIDLVYLTLSSIPPDETLEANDVIQAVTALYQ